MGDIRGIDRIVPVDSLPGIINLRVLNSLHLHISRTSRGGKVRSEIVTYTWRSVPEKRCEENSRRVYLSDNGVSTYQRPGHNGRNCYYVGRLKKFDSLCWENWPGNARAHVIRAATKAISFRVHVAVIGFLSFSGTAVAEVNVRIAVTRRVLTAPAAEILDERRLIPRE